MRTIKASEVVKGMRVRVVKDVPADGPLQAHTLTYEGEIRRTDHGTGCDTFAGWYWADGDGETWACLDPDHPVTVLAEPEEWVEGAWYRCRVGTNEPENLRRLPHGWSPFHDTDRVFHLDDDPDITVLGRVLIVDWPGDDVARELDAINDGNRSTSLSNYGRTTTHDTILRNVADAIRTQGGAR